MQREVAGSLGIGTTDLMWRAKEQIQQILGGDKSYDSFSWKTRLEPKLNIGSREAYEKMRKNIRGESLRAPTRVG